MGQLIHKKGDVLTSKTLIIGHSVNCRGGFGSGIAGQIAKKYPIARQSYLNKFRNEGWCLGEVQFVPIVEDMETTPCLIIANCAMQDTYGRTGVHVNYPAVEKSLRKLLEFAEYMEADVAIPRVGAGLGGGDWSRIQAIIEKTLLDYNVIVECYDYET